MATWSEFAASAPGLAVAGRRLFYQYGPGLGFLATVRADGGPRLHPVCPVITGDGLYVFVVASPKGGDLERDGRYALHALLPDEVEEEFAVSGRAPAVGEALPLRDHEMCQGLDAAALAVLETRLEPREYAPGDYVVRRGTVAEEMFFLVSGEVSVLVDLASGQVRRLATLSAGMAFGELALVDRTTRTADVRADVAVRCDVLSAAAFDALGRDHPTIRLTLLQNMLRRAYQVVSQLNQELAALAG